MGPEDILQRLIVMVSGVELATTAVMETLVENGVISRETLLRGLIEKRDKLDPKYSKGSLDMMIERLAPKSADGLH
jgi:hypothetical protein